MRRKLGIAFLLSLSLSLIATAQEKSKRHYFHLAEVLVYVNGIDQELKLSKAEFVKVREIVDQVCDKYQAELDHARSDKGGRKWRPVVDKVVDETNKALSEVLSAKQIDRLKQILRQRYALNTLEENAKMLELSGEQQKQIAAVSKEEVPGISTEQEKKIVDRAISVLTPEQRKKWESLVGTWYVPPAR